MRNRENLGVRSIKKQNGEGEQKVNSPSPE
jgi:hypothetical protein